jgi:hypothetical protein
MPIPDELAKAFERAVDLYCIQWSPRGVEPTIGYDGKPNTIADICALVVASGSADEVTPALLSRLLADCFHNQPRGDLRGKVVSDQSYVNCAQCLLSLIRYRKTVGQ